MTRKRPNLITRRQAIASLATITTGTLLKPTSIFGFEPGDSKTRFAVIGDFGNTGPSEQAVANLVHSWNPDFIATVGDNNYDTGSASTIDANIGQYYHDYIYPYLGSYGSGSPTATNRFWPTLGNHDWGDTFPNPTGDQPYLNYFTSLPGNGQVSKV